MTLTLTQHSALGDLRHRGALVASPHAFGPAGRTYSTRTLSALVAAGYARWETVRGVPGAPAIASGIVPIDAPAPDLSQTGLGCVGYDREPHTGNDLTTVNGLCPRCTARLDRDVNLRALVDDWHQLAVEAIDTVDPDETVSDPEGEVTTAAADTMVDCARALAAVLDGSPS